MRNIIFAKFFDVTVCLMSENNYIKFLIFESACLSADIVQSCNRTTY